MQTQNMQQGQHVKNMRSLERTLTRHALMGLSAGEVEFALRRMENLDSVRQLRQTTECLEQCIIEAIGKF